MVCTNFLKIECIFLYIYYNIAFLKSIPTRRMSFLHFGTFLDFLQKTLDIFCRKNPVRPNDLTGHFSFLLIIDNTTFVLSSLFYAYRNVYVYFFIDVSFKIKVL